MSRNLILFIFLFLNTLIFSQSGRISGSIMDSKTGETLPGATAMIEGTGKGAQADFDGKFSINNVADGKYTIVVSYISYTTKKITGVTVKGGDVVQLNVQLDASSSGDLAEVEVVVTLNKENNTALVLQQKNNTSVSDGVSAETIRRTPDRNTSDVLKRVTGVTIQDDKFVIVRGLNERYNASYLNGAPLPSTEPDKKAFAFDLFPANMLDNIVVNKTATPDMPSEFAGGIVQVNTKSIPEKNFVSVSGGMGYNSVTTGKQKTIYEGGKWDKWGFDDHSRDLPSEIPAFEDKSSWIANPDQARMATYFKNDWEFERSKFKPNSSIQIAAGYNLKLKEKDFLGVIFSLSNNSTQSLYTLTRTEYEPMSPSNEYSLRPDVEQTTTNTVNQTQTSTGALLNLTCKINSNNSISAKNMFTGAADNKFITAVSVFPIGAPGIHNRVNSRFFSANKVRSSQLNGEHFIPLAKIKINWNYGYSGIERSVPNLRFMSYTKLDSILPTGDPTVPENPKDTVYKADVARSTTGPNYAGYRAYSKLNETIKSSRIDLSRLFTITKSFKIDLKIGGMLQNRSRQYNIRQFGLNTWNNPPTGTAKAFTDSLLYLPEDQIFAAQNMSITPDGYGGFKLNEITKYDDNYRASSKLTAFYGMAEIKYTEKLRLIGGVRYEAYHQDVKIKFRFGDSTFVDTTVVDLLPSVNLIYNINEKLGVRLAWYKTLNRAEFRELAITNWFDPETRLSVAGNAGLQRCYIQNFDARFEIYPGRGQLFTMTGFYKYFDKPIERYMQANSESQIYYRNANFATVYGGELEYRMNLGAILKKDSIKWLNNLTLFSNLSLIKSEVNVAGINSRVPDTRQMQGQAPYIINSGISYIDNEHGFSVTSMINRVGERIYIVGNNLIGDRYENARTVWDMQFTKSFFKNRLDLRFNIKDMLQQDYIIFFKGEPRLENNKYKKDVDLVNFQRNYGATYSFIVSFRF
jgi:TonB-dependent receptor